MQHERKMKLMHIGINMKGIWKEHEKKWILNTNERKIKGNECRMKRICMQMKGKWKEMNAEWKEDECKWKENERTWMQNESNMNCSRSSWNQQNNSSIDFRACLGLDFGFMLDLKYANVYKTLESDRPPPKAITITIASYSIYSDVKDFDGSI